MSYAIITTRVDPQTKKQATKMAAQLGMPVSKLMKTLLQQFIKTKRLSFEQEEVPNAKTIAALKESEEDVKAGRVISFSTPQEAIDYLNKEILDEKQSASQSH